MKKDGRLSKFLQNKNTVTVLGVVLMIAILYVMYNVRVQQATSPVSVPYAKETISSGTQITASMVGTKEVSRNMITDGILRTTGDVIDKYANVDTVIPAGSLFYERAVVEKEQLPANIILKYPKGHVLYNMPVSISSTYGNSIYPGNYIDIYLRATYKLDNDLTKYTDEELRDANKMMYGKLISNVKVLAVKDAAGRAVFQNIDEQRTPSMIIFAVNEEMNKLLRKAENLQTYNSELIPVPTNESLKDEPEETKISNDKLKAWIESVTVADE